MYKNEVDWMDLIGDRESLAAMTWKRNASAIPTLKDNRRTKKARQIGYSSVPSVILPIIVHQWYISHKENMPPVKVHFLSLLFLVFVSLVQNLILVAASSESQKYVHNLLAIYFLDDSVTRLVEKQDTSNHGLVTLYTPSMVYRRTHQANV
jgi:hypothetical protein